jgi:hypothetical protein
MEDIHPQLHINKQDTVQLIMKKVAIMQPYLFPYIGYFQLINAVDEYVIYDDVQFIKGGWINRNNILIGGRKNLVTFPLIGASANKNINEIHIQQNLDKLEKTIFMAYSKAPYITNVSKLIKNIFDYNERNLARFAGNSIVEVSKYLDLQTRFIYSSDLDKKDELSAQPMVIDICKKLEADTYINAIGGTELYDKEAFAKQDIELKFLKPSLPEYKQFNNEFIPGLSIIDILMFNDIEKIKSMLNDYELL